MRRWVPERPELRPRFRAALASLDLAVEIIEKGLRVEKRRIEKLRRTFRVELSTEDLDEQAVEELVRFDLREHAQVVRRSLLFSYWSTLEGLVAEFADEARWNLELRLAPSDLGHTGIERSLTYLRKVAEIEIDLNEIGWPRILDLRRIRNHLVHNGPSVTSERKPGRRRKLLLAIEETPGVDLDEDAIYVAEMFFPNALGRIGDFLVGIEVAVSARYEGLGEE